jgi:hypothetical protein
VPFIVGIRLGLAGQKADQRYRLLLRTRWDP